MAVLVPTSHPLFSRHCITRPSHASSPNPLRPSGRITFSALCSSLELPKITGEDEAASSSTPLSENGVLGGPEFEVETTENLKESGCKTCGRVQIENGCNGEGRIQGGIATVPGFGWWPIKAFRPCPGFVASGGRYRRRGQSMDEVVSGRGEMETSMRSTNKVQAR